MATDEDLGATEPSVVVELLRTISVKRILSRTCILSRPDIRYEREINRRSN